jgi:NADH-quinone oxidoreductase subunit I
VDCIFMGSIYDISTYSRDGCVVDYAKLPLEIAWGQATLNPTAVLESKRVSLPVWTKGPEPQKPTSAPPAPPVADGPAAGGQGQA